MHVAMLLAAVQLKRQGSPSGCCQDVCMPVHVKQLTHAPHHEDRHKCIQYERNTSHRCMNDMRACQTAACSIITASQVKQRQSELKEGIVVWMKGEVTRCAYSVHCCLSAADCQGSNRTCGQQRNAGHMKLCA